MGFDQCPPVAETTRLWFIRHGEVESPYVGTFLGTTDVGLSEVGRHQAQAVSGFLEPMELDAIITSPLRRAVDTATPTATARGIEPVKAEWAMEMHFGAWEGRQWADIEQDDPDFAKAWQGDPGSIPCPDGDAADDFARRVQDGLAELLREYRGQAVALFAHAGTNRAILSAVTRRPYMESFVFSQDYGSVNAAGWDPETGHGQIAMLNVVPGPPSEMHGDGGRRVGGSA